MKRTTPTKQKVTAGDVLRINITPARRASGEDKSWIKIYRHPHGIKHKGLLTSDQAEAAKGQSRATVARLIGEEVIASSTVLRKLFKAKR